MEGYQYVTADKQEVATVYKEGTFVYAKFDSKYFNIEMFRKLMMTIIPNAIKKRILEFKMKEEAMKNEN